MGHGRSNLNSEVNIQFEVFSQGFCDIVNWSKSLPNNLSVVEDFSEQIFCTGIVHARMPEQTPFLTKPLNKEFATRILTVSAYQELEVFRELRWNYDCNVFRVAIRALSNLGRPKRDNAPAESPVAETLCATFHNRLCRHSEIVSQCLDVVIHRQFLHVA